MADLSVSGIASGIDWDGMIETLITNASKPAMVQVTKRDNLELKKGLFEEFQVMLQQIQSSLTPLKLASTYKMKGIVIDRLDSNASYKGVLSATVNADAAINVYDLEVKQLAKSQTVRSNQFTSYVGSAFASGVSDLYFDISAAGQKVRIGVSSNDTLTDIAAKINSQVNLRVPPVAVTASVVDDQLILKSDNTGLGTSSYKGTILRAVSGTDTIEFSTDTDGDGTSDSTLIPTLDFGGMNGGVLKVTRGNTTYTQGVDFDVVNGNQIRWRDYKLPYILPGYAYSGSYTLTAGETYTKAETRSSGGDTDSDVVPANMTGYAAAGFSILDADGVTTYTEGTDFTVSDHDIVWTATGSRPADGTVYTVTYTSAAGGEIFDFVSGRETTDAIAGGPAFSSFTDKTVTIRGSNGRTYTQGADFDIVPDVAGKATVRWRTESGYIAPPPGAAYTIDVQSSNGTVTTYNGTARSAVDQPQFNGTVSGGGTVAINGGYTGVTASVSPGGSLLLDWSGTANGPITPNPNVPQWTGNTKDVYTVEYTYNTNTFALTDDGNGLLNALGLDLTDDVHFTAAQDAVMVLDGETVTRSSNNIGESWKNELIKGMTITLKGTGRVQLDVEQDAEAAVTGVQTFLSAYNDLLSWINTRMTEKAVDENTKATLDSDDFRMKWGLLTGNSLLRSTKDTLRRLTSQVYTTSTTQRKSSAPVYGPMSQNGIVNPGIITVTVGARVLSLTISPDDTLQSIADRINSKELDGEKNPLFFDPDGQEYPIPFVKALVESNQLTIQAGTDRPVSVGGDGAILRAMGVNYAYSTLSSVGLKLASTGAMSDQGKAGTLDFDSAVFMEALEANAEDVSLLMTNFVGQMQTYMDNMLKTSQIEVASGVTTAQGALAREINAIDAEITSIDKYLTEFDRRLESKRENLFTQFSAAETNLAKLMQQANWLSSVTAQLQSASS